MRAKGVEVVDEGGDDGSGVGQGSEAMKPGAFFLEGANEALAEAVLLRGVVPKRLKRHEASGKKAPGVEAKVTPIPGGKTARETAEHNRIQEITGGVPARKSDKVTNKKDPIGPKRKKK